MQGYDGCSLVLGLWAARLFWYMVLKVLACNNIYVCPFACSLVLLSLCQDSRIPSHAVGAYGVSAADHTVLEVMVLL